MQSETGGGAGGGGGSTIGGGGAGPGLPAHPETATSPQNSRPSKRPGAASFQCSPNGLERRLQPAPAARERSGTAPAVERHSPPASERWPPGRERRSSERHRPPRGDRNRTTPPTLTEPRQPGPTPSEHPPPPRERRHLRPQHVPAAQHRKSLRSHATYLCASSPSVLRSPSVIAVAIRPGFRFVASQP